MAGNVSVPGAGVTGRFLAILGTFDTQNHRLSLCAIARRAEVPLPTAHRLVAELVEHGALARAGGDYVIGRRLCDVELLAPVQSTLRETASPFLNDIYAATLAALRCPGRTR